ncbi:hypothetical protein Leryth_014980 [Lithospermum erythrorhizon]|nr:hypothetical protein Leryth_014980 [Lithospermum erythrorhizon]
MAFLLKKTSLSTLCLHSQKSVDSLTVSRRGIHVEAGAREKAVVSARFMSKQQRGKKPDNKQAKAHSYIVMPQILASRKTEPRTVNKSSPRILTGFATGPSNLSSEC